MVLETMELISTDVLVIGGGGAGLRAAIEAKQRGVDVLILSKSPVGYANNTAISGGAFAAASGWRDPSDNPDEHLKDTVIGGRFVNDQRLVEVMARGGTQQVLDLETYGVEFRKRGEDVWVTRAAGHSHARSVSVTKLKGIGFTEPMRQYALKLGVKFEEGVIVTKLLRVQDEVVGATGLGKDGRVRVYSAKSVILATGGAGALYQVHDNARGSSGDGYALAYELGLPFVDMEFVQTSHGTAWEALVMGARGVIRNSLGEDILLKYGLEDAGRTTRATASRVVMLEVAEGKGVDGGAVLDLSAVPDEVLERYYRVLSKRYVTELSAGKRQFRVLPEVHFFMGGMKINEISETGIAGLYAAGEVTGGVHGANRLGSNAITEIFVFGMIAGANAAERAMAAQSMVPSMKVAFAENERLQAFVSPRGRNNLHELLSQLQKTMWENAGIIRDEARLKRALQDISAIRQALEKATVSDPSALVKVVELENMLTVSEMIAKAALLRTESRGSHDRLDFPHEDNERWLKNILIRKENGQMKLWTEPVDMVKVGPEAGASMASQYLG